MFAGRVQGPGGERDVRLVRVPFPLGEAGFGALLVLDEQGTFVAAGIVDDFGTPLEEWSNLLGSLQHYQVPRLASARPRSHLAKVRAEASKEKGDPDARLTLALLDVLGHMNEQASVFNIPSDMLVLDQEEAAEMMSVQYASVLGLAADLTPLLGGSVEEFERLARDSAERAADMAAGARQQDRALASKAQRRVMANCSSCHRMPLEGPGGPTLSEVFTAARVERGIGDGYWQVGHDVRIHHADREKLQHVVDALRTGALLIDATR